MNVRAAVLREMGLPPPYAESRPLQITELELASPGPDEVMIRVYAAGLCHSDLSVIDGSRPRVMPMVLGHEAAGEVVEVGAGVSELMLGDHVVLAFVPSCGRCPSCLDGRAALCEPWPQVARRRRDHPAHHRRSALRAEVAGGGPLPRQGDRGVQEGAQGR